MTEKTEDRNRDRDRTVSKRNLSQKQKNKYRETPKYLGKCQIKKQEGLRLNLAQNSQSPYSATNIKEREFAPIHPAGHRLTQ